MSEPIHPAKYYTLRQVCWHLQVCPKTVQRMHATGGLAVYRLPTGALRILGADLLGCMRPAWPCQELSTPQLAEA